MRLSFALLFAATPVVAQTPSPRLPHDTVLARMTAFVDSLAAAGEFSGVVAMAKEGRPVFAKAWGMADRERGIANDTGTAFNLGSINKAFTATAVRQLAAQGRLSVDSALGRYWPDYPNAAVRAATVGQLLRMQSGIGGDIFGRPASGDRHDLRHNDQFLPLFAHEPMAFAPGTSRAYANAGYVVLGMLVQRLSGADYYAYVRRHVFEPAGMTRTGSFAVDSLPPNTAVGYTAGFPEPDGRGWRPNTPDLPGRGSAAGGGYSTAGDLLRFVQALRERRIAAGGPPGVGIAGGAPGTNAVLEGDLPGGYDLVVLTNLDPPAAMRVAERVRQWLGAVE